MNRAILIAGLLVATILGGCVPSLNPFYNAADLKYDEHLVGTWKGSGEEKESWTFAKGEEKAYKLTIREDQKSSEFSAHLFSLGDQLFLDIFPETKGLEDTQTSWLQVSLVPAHLLLRVHELGAKFKCSMLQEEWLSETLKNNPKALAHTRTQDDRLVLTAPTPDLQTFVTAHLKTAKAWSDPNEMGRAEHKKSK